MGRAAEQQICRAVEQQRRSWEDGAGIESCLDLVPTAFRTRYRFASISIAIGVLSSVLDPVPDPELDHVLDRGLRHVSDHVLDREPDRGPARGLSRVLDPVPGRIAIRRADWERWKKTQENSGNGAIESRRRRESAN